MAVDESDEARVYLTAAVKLRGGGGGTGRGKKQQETTTNTSKDDTSEHRGNIFNEHFRPCKIK